MRFHTGQTVRVIHQRTVDDTRIVPRLILPGDQLTVVAHTPGEGVVRCVQGGPARCTLKVPPESIRVVGHDGGDSDGVKESAVENVELEVEDVTKAA